MTGQINLGKFLCIWFVTYWLKFRAVLYFYISPAHFNYRCAQVLGAAYVTSKSLNSFPPQLPAGIRLNTNLIVLLR